MSPTASIHDAEDARHRDDVPVARILAQSSNVGAITLAEKLGQERLKALDQAVRLRRTDRHRLSRRERRAIPSRPSRGRARRSATCRSARASPSPRCRWQPPVRLDRERRHPGTSRTSSTGSPGSRARLRSHSVVSSRRRSPAQLKAMLTERRPREGTGTLAAIPGYPRRGQDRHRGTSPTRARAATQPARPTSPRSSAWCRRRTQG